MFKNFSLETDCGMDSPISLNDIDNSEQFHTFSIGESNINPIKPTKLPIPVLRIDLTSLSKKEDIQVVSIGYKAIRRKENTTQFLAVKRKSVTSTVTRQVISKKNICRPPLQEKNTIKSYVAKPVETMKYKSLSPFVRQITVNASRFSKDQRSEL
ncbi:hypothetical protein SteCoe_21472 [Stentor coeruleus]|uniref:Uncharacterized protein n=1 Tax=Stentor coeruleus TaxID=5963 RepID=A0A1R2BPM1_9CILI|nr:hypothetical protein SteCoe_21472 [Stentor coeruleus]